MLRAHRGDNHRRGWLAAALLAAGLVILGLADLLARAPRETSIAAPIVGGILPVLGAVGMVRGTRRVTGWIRYPLVFVMTLVLLFAGLLIGATFASRLIPV